jgi:hypothetical protein
LRPLGRFDPLDGGIIPIMKRFSTGFFASDRWSILIFWGKKANPVGRVGQRSFGDKTILEFAWYKRYLEY